MKIWRIFFLIQVAFASCAASATSPVLLFSDLISGPSTGLSDGYGSGAIVTLWGQHLGEAGGIVEITDVNGEIREAAYLYYWKKANGDAPGGPANLYESHGMYEVAFSLPQSAEGLAAIHVTTANGKQSNALPFTIRTGNIYHVKPTGDNINGDGSFNAPWEFVNGNSYTSKAPGNGNVAAGDTVYSHAVEEPVLGGQSQRGFFLRQVGEKDAEQVAFVSYPGKASLIQGPKRGVQPYYSYGIVISKYRVLAGERDDPMDENADYWPATRNPADSTNQIGVSANGRIVGNYVGELEGKCSNGWSGAIGSGKTGGDNVKILGNHIHDIGCPQTSHFHHTTYMSRRSSENLDPINAWEFGWNYLQDNKAIYGLHNYDLLESGSASDHCDDVQGEFKIHDNYIINQRGPGIHVYTSSNTQHPASECWSADVSIYNNILINTGLGPMSELNNGTSPYAIRVGGNIGGDISLVNNLIYDVSDESSRTPVYSDESGSHSRNYTPYALSLTFSSEMETDRSVDLINNILYTSYPMQFVSSNKPYQDQSNILYSPTVVFDDGNADQYLAQMSNAITVDPLVVFDGQMTGGPRHIYLDHDSPAIGQGTPIDYIEGDFFSHQSKLSTAQNIGPLVGATSSSGSKPIPISTSPPNPPANVTIRVNVDGVN